MEAADGQLTRVDGGVDEEAMHYNGSKAQQQQEEVTDELFKAPRARVQGARCSFGSRLRTWGGLRDRVRVLVFRCHCNTMEFIRRLEIYHKRVRILGYRSRKS